MIAIETVTDARVREIISLGGVVFPYPRKGRISINGGRLQPATKQALQLAKEYVKSKKQS
jgi:hypothetical protein